MAVVQEEAVTTPEEQTWIRLNAQANDRWILDADIKGAFGSPDFMVYNVTNNTFIIMDFYLDYRLDLPGVKVESCTQIDGKILLGLRIVGEGMVCHPESKLYRTIASESTNLSKRFASVWSSCVFKSPATAVLLS